MHRFYADPERSEGDIVSLDREDAYHAVKVLRLHCGDPVEIVISGIRHAGTVRDISETEVTVWVGDALPSNETGIRFVLFQGVPKGDKMDLIVQKATELGVSVIVPVMMTRSVVRLDPKDRLKKQERWQKIAREAGKQSGRCVIPEVHVPVSLKESEASIRALDAVAVPWESGKDTGPLAFVRAHPDIRSLGIVIGPEGGIDEKELELAISTGFKPITLGKRILRTETAGMTVMSILMYHLESD